MVAGINCRPILLGDRAELDVSRPFDIYVFLSLLSELMPLLSVFAATSISISCPVKAKITKNSFRGLQ
ncbi:MAG TPA: hypothetical protein VEL11_17925 [Candidatus Bathyarchaeia archaeon]|nr:hypothetical protein [Candidatus Bathyarchaeia archaeon]